MRVLDYLVHACESIFKVFQTKEKMFSKDFDGVVSRYIACPINFIVLCFQLAFHPKFTFGLAMR